MARTPETSPRWNAAHSDHAGARAAAPGAIRVLVVDDSDAVREGLSMLLNSRPYCEVVGAVDDPHSAMRLARDAEPHVVLLDFSMPLVDPLALTAEIVACRPRPSVLMLSALANEHSATRAAAAGAVGWVLKDAEPDTLFAALVRAARSADPGWEESPAFATDVAARAPRDVAEAAAALEAATAGDPATGEAGKLDARTVRALLVALRALDGDVMGATAAELAGHAVVSPRVAERILKRLLCRAPALVAAVDVESPVCRYVLTAAGAQELDRLERHVAGDVEELDVPRVPCAAP